MKTNFNIKFKYSIVVLNICMALFVTSFFLSCNKPEPDEKDQIVSTTISLYDSIAKRSDLSEFTKMLVIAGYSDLFSKSTRTTSTLFTPTNDALKAFFVAKYNKSSVSEFLGSSEDSATIKNIVNNHVVIGSIQFVDSLKLPVSGLIVGYNTMNGESLIAVYKEGGVNNMYINGISKVLNPDIKCINGIFHVVDKVIFNNEIPSVGQKLVSDTSKSIFLEALQRTRYFDTINNLNYSDKKLNMYTVFAVSNKYYHEKGIYTIDQLATSLNSTDATKLKDPLNLYVSGHIIKKESRLFFNSLNSEINTLNEQSLLFTKTLDYVVVNRTAGKPDVVIDILNNNFVCSNGLIHELNGIIVVEEKAPTTVFVIFNETFTNEPWYSTADNVNLSDSTAATYSKLFRSSDGAIAKSSKWNQGSFVPPLGHLYYRGINLWPGQPENAWWEFDIVNKPLKVGFSYSIWVHAVWHPNQGIFNIEWNGVRLTQYYSNPLRVGDKNGNTKVSTTNPLYKSGYFTYGYDANYVIGRDNCKLRCKIAEVKIGKKVNTIRFIQQLTNQFSCITGLEFVPL